MKKKITICILFIIVLLFAIKHFVYEKNTNDIENINIIDIENIKSIEISVEYGYPHSIYSYKIDFLNSSILHEIEDYDKSENFYTDFTYQEAEFFVEKANQYGFFNWEESYDNPNIEDGEGIDIFINFKDGSIKETLCYNAYPPNSDVMAEVFHEAFGLII